MSFTAPEDAFLDVNDAHLRVYGNVHADGLKLGQLEVVTTTSTGSTINFLHQHTAFTTTSNIDVGTTNHDLFVDTNTSRVGIGTNTPGKTLDVNGEIRGTFLHGDGSNISNITSSQWTTVNSNEIHYAGNVGIGLADPAFKLDVDGDINFTGTLREDGNPFVSTPWTIESGPTALSYTGGNVGIGAGTPSAKLEVTGNAHVSTDLTVAGKIGVGVDSPAANLQVVGNCHVSTNMELGGTLVMGTVTVEAQHALSAITATGNTTPHTVEFQNAGTSLVTTGNVQVGKELHMQYTDNVAKIQANSNVVTEFSRSKKLIKYPRVALTTSPDQGYTATASSIWSGASSSPWQAFDNVWDPDGSGTNSWETANNSFASGNSKEGPRLSTGNSTFDNRNGEYLNIKLPEKIVLQRIKHTTRADRWWEGPWAGFIYGSNDGFTNYEMIHSFWDISGASYVHIINATTAYDEYRFHVTHTQASTYLSICLFDLYGVPENDSYDQGSDVTIKSYPNVPNTDFLDVFVDAGNTNGYELTGSSVTSVIDLASPPANAMTVAGVTYDSTNKAFVFSGSSSSYIKATLQNGNGNYAHTLSAWFMMTDYSNNWRSIMGVGSNATGEQSVIAYDPDQDQLYFGTYGADIYVPHKPELGRWYHVAATFLGGSTTSTSMNIYLNGVNMGGVPDGTQTPSFTGDQLCIGGTMNSGGTQANNPFKGQIANARFYRREYSPDEIYQLYAHQKEDFGGDLSMTLKAGRLGIGTSEPRAALDVRGTLKVNGPATFTGRPNFTESLFFYTGNAGSNYYVSTYKNLHGYYLNTLIPPDSHIGNYGTGGDNQCFTEGNYGSSNELCGSHFDSMVYWLKYAPVGHVHRLNWCSNNGSGGSQTYGQKTSDTQIRLWGYWFHTGTYDRDWSSGVYFSISTSTISVSYQGAAFQ